MPHNSQQNKTIEDHIIEFYNTCFRKKVKLTETRIKAIKKSLEHYSLSEIKQAIYGCICVDTTVKNKYKTLEFILRKSSKYDNVTRFKKICNKDFSEDVNEEIVKEDVVKDYRFKKESVDSEDKVSWGEFLEMMSEVFDEEPNVFYVDKDIREQFDKVSLNYDRNVFDMAIKYYFYKHYFMLTRGMTHFILHNLPVMAGKFNVDVYDSKMIVKLADKYAEKIGYVRKKFETTDYSIYSDEEMTEIMLGKKQVNNK